jgi:tryptophan halogenase
MDSGNHNHTGTPRRVGVLGGGTAGYLTALALNRHLPGATVEVIAAPDIPVIGVGESTFPQIVAFLHDYLGLDAAGFYEAVQPTWKLGTRFVWGLPGDHWFNFPFDRTDHAAAHADGFDVRGGSLLAVLMDNEKSFLMPREGSDTYNLLTRNGYAYQLDNRRLIAYLRDQVARAGIALVDAHINRVDVDETRDNIRALHATDGRSFAYDLYIDCSGFRSVLLEGALGVPHVSYGSSLFVDSAIVGSLPNQGRIRPYTTATTMEHGWSWLISMREEDHLGYVFSSAHCTPEAASAEMKRKFGLDTHPHVLRFPRGRHAVPWKGNLLAVGNSYAFVEPLQATGIQMILSAIRHAVDVFMGPRDRDDAVRRYNDLMNTKWDFLRGFIAMHYRFNKRLDTSFWQDCWRDVDLAGITELIAYFHERGLLSLADPRTREGFTFLWDAGLFGTNGMDIILLGQGERPGGKPEEDTSRVAWLRKKRAVWTEVSDRALPQNRALQLVERNPWILRRDSRAS